MSDQIQALAQYSPDSVEIAINSLGQEEKTLMTNGLTKVLGFLTSKTAPKKKKASSDKKSHKGAPKEVFREVVKKIERNLEIYEARKTSQQGERFEVYLDFPVNFQEMPLSEKMRVYYHLENINNNVTVLQNVLMFFK